MFFHVWFAPKGRKWLLQGDVEHVVQDSLTQVDREHGIRMIAHSLIVDHVHLLLELSHEQGLSGAVRLLKGASARKVFQQCPELRLDAGVRNFWQKRYGHRLVQPGEVDRVCEYVKTQWDRLEEFERGAG